MTSTLTSAGPVVEAFLEAFSRDATAAITDFLADTGEWHVMGTLPISGIYPKPAALELFKPLLDAFSSLELSTVGTTVEGERVAAEVVAHGELADGRSYDNTYHFLFVVRDGRLHQVKEYGDTYQGYVLFFS